MAGSDPSSSGGSTPARNPLPRSAKRKRGGDESAGPPPSRATRGSDAARAERKAARKAAAGPVRLARHAGAGALWAERKWRGRGFGFGDVEVERMRAVILEVRGWRSFHVPDNVANSLYPRESYLSSPQISVGIGDKHQASVPEWENAPSEEETDHYRAESLTRIGTVVCPLNMDISASNEKRKTRKELVDNCNCTHPGSEDCVRVHVTKARVWIKDQLGEEAFKNCGLDAMGEQVGELWTAVEKKKLEHVCKLIRQNDQSFVEITKDLSPKQTKDLLKYYYNVFHPRSLARLTREEHKKKEAVDRDDQKSSQSDENNGRRPRKNGRSSGSSSTRCRK